MAKKVPPPPVQRPHDPERSRSSEGVSNSGNGQALGREHPHSGSQNGAIPRTPRFTGREANSVPESPSTRQTGFFDFPNLFSSDPNSAEVTAIEGQELYLHFVHEQLRSAQLGDLFAEEEERLSELHLSEAHCEDGAEVDGAFARRRRRNLSMNLENFQNPIWRQTGRELQTLADAFARSNERLLVRERASQVDVLNLDKEKFFAMLAELFQGGHVTRERILVLFFFCSDVAIIAVRTRISGLLAQLTRWSIMFIREQVCAWVHQNGGWSTVLRSSLNLVHQVAMIGMCAAVFTCCIIYIRKNLN